MMRVSVLGGQSIIDDRTDGVPVRSSHSLVLVAFLAVHAGSPQPRARIAGLFWPESTDAQALTNLRRELHHLRRVLRGEQSLVVTARDLCWRDTQTCLVDVRVFDTERKAALAAAAASDDEGVMAHGAAAISQYRGELLPGSYDDWLIDARTALERQCADLCDLLSAASKRAGDLTAAVEAARRRIQLQPLEEVGYRALMGLQADLGDRAGAVSTYHHCASVLERELGVVPDDSTREAFDRLMARARPGAKPGEVRDGGVRVREGGGRESGVRESGIGRPGPTVARFIGRSAELSMLTQTWRAAVEGNCGVALVRGGAGVGKTRLVTEVAESARQHGAVVASTQCFGTHGRLALAPVADWLRHPAVRSAAATLDPAWQAEVGRLVPLAADRRDGDGQAGPGALVDAWQRHRFYEGLARALIAVERPLLLVLDNVQWCDQETLAFITFCMQLRSGPRLLVAGTLRDDSLHEDPELTGWTERMRATGLLTELSLGPLEAAGTARLAEAICGQRLRKEDTDLLHATTGGFPLYVIEAVRGGTADVRGGLVIAAGDLGAVLRKRLEQATAEAQEVAALAAAVGTNFSLDLLAEACELEPDVVVEAVDELWRRRIMREFEDDYDFSHDLLREAAYSGISPPRRWLLHRRIAQALELLHSGNTDPVAAQLAEQYAQAGRPGRALAYYQRAADVAAGRFAHTEAIRLYRQALSVVRRMPDTRDRDTQELAVLEALAAPLNARDGYASPGLQRTLERSIALGERLGRRDSVLSGLVGLWASRFVQGRTADSYQVATRALDLVDPGSQLGSQAHFAVGGSAVSLGMPAEGVRHLELAGQLAGGPVMLSVGTRRDVHSTAWAAHAHWLLGSEEAAQRACHEAIAMARAIGHPYTLAVALAYGGVTSQMRHDLAGLRTVVDELRDLCERYEFAYYREWALILDGWSASHGPDIGLAELGIGNLKSAGAFARMPYWLSLLADLSARAGRPAAARATLDAALAAGRAHDDVWWLPEVMRQRARYDGEEAAIARLRSAAELASSHGSVALLRRCERDLRSRDGQGAGVARAADPGVRAAGNPAGG
jgi:DNA-binding SARP family transcriptional activator/tetratricopeptide (TPR) repeat protein